MVVSLTHRKSAISAASFFLGNAHLKYIFGSVFGCEVRHCWLSRSSRFSGKSAIFGCVFLLVCESPPFWLRISFVGIVESPPSLVVSFFRYLKVRHLGCAFLSESPPTLVLSFFSCVKVHHFGCVFLSLASLKVRRLWLCLSFVIWKSAILAASFFRKVHLFLVASFFRLSGSPPILVASFFRLFSRKPAIFGCVFLSLYESPPSWLRLSFGKSTSFWLCLSSIPLVCSTHHRLSHNSLAEFIASRHKHKPRLSLPSKKKKKLFSPN